MRGNVLIPQEVAARVYHAATREPISVLMLFLDKANAAADDPGLIRVYHHAAMYFPNLGHDSPWDNMAFAFIGGLISQQVQKMLLPVDLFHQVPVFMIPNEVNKPFLQPTPMQS